MEVLRPSAGVLREPAVGSLRGTWNIATTITSFASHTVKLGAWRHNRDMLLQTQDAGGPRGNFRFDSDGTGLPSERRRSRAGHSMASSWSTGQPPCSETSRSSKSPAPALGRLFFAQDKWQAKPNITIDLGMRWEYYTPLTGLEGPEPVELRPATNTLRASGYGDTSDSVDVKNTSGT